MEPNLRLRYERISALRHAIRDAKHGGMLTPEGVLKIIQDGDWKDFVVTETGELVRYERFVDFVTTQPLEGLGFTIDLLRNLCRDDLAALDALDQVTANGVGRPANRSESLQKRPEHESTPGTLRRLRKDAPELHARALAGELSPHAAAVEAGFRPRRVSVRTDDVDSAARTLARAFGDRLGELQAAIDRNVDGQGGGA